MSSISYRLTQIRERSGLSLRAFVETIEQRAGVRVAHDSARRYESGETRVPAEYVVQVCQSFGVSTEWLLLGNGSPVRLEPSLVERAFEEFTSIMRRVQAWEGTAGGGSLKLVEEEWERFTEQLPPRHPLRGVILDSWHRSLRAGVEHAPDELPLRRVSDAELSHRRSANKRLIRAAEPHLAWLSAATSDQPHVVYLVCADGIVLHAVGNDLDLFKQWGLEPGADWSEKTMGTSGAGTALASGSVVAVLGPEHYMRPIHGSTCLATPIRDPAGRIVGAIDLSTSFAGWRPDRLVLVAYAGEMMERDLARSIT